MKLNLGCGDIKLDGYTNLDIKNGDSIYPLIYVDESIDEIRASHVLEHFSYLHTISVLREWNRVLKLDGVIKIAVPDFDKLITEYRDSPFMERILMGGHVDENDYHKAIFTKESLMDYLYITGFNNFENWESEIHDCAKLPFSLNIKAVKTFGIVDSNGK